LKTYERLVDSMIGRIAVWIVKGEVRNGFQRLACRKTEEKRQMSACARIFIQSEATEETRTEDVVEENRISSRAWVAERSDCKDKGQDNCQRLCKVENNRCANDSRASRKYSSSFASGRRPFVRRV
jgi:hypothetical protein